MIDQLTLQKLEAVLKGVKPADPILGETTAEYLHCGIQSLATGLDKVRQDRDDLLKCGAHML